MAATKVKPIPDGYHSVTPYLIVDGAARALEFYRKAFGAEEMYRFPRQDGRIGHAEFRVGNSVVMIADEHPEIGARGPKSIGGTPISLMVYVEDVDKVFDRAVQAGATVERAVATQFYGDRTGGIVDPFGHKWYLATHVEDVPPDEMQKRAKAAGRE
ncbi:MAG: VOC family protein [Myxococcales bacterium]|nr:VOC family protein [Myxococcales bacterium]